MKQQKELVDSLKKQGVLKSKRVIAAFEAVDRRDFVPETLKEAAYFDEPLPIGQGQTISQPFTVAFMLERLDAQDGDMVFDVGSGSGWQAAMLAHLVGQKGKVYAMEIVPALCEFSKSNLAKYENLIQRVVFECGDATAGVRSLPVKESLDRIVAAATLDEVPSAWRAQLKIGGKMIYPSQGSLFEEVKLGEDEFKLIKYPGFVFVPFVKGVISKIYE
ncbi:protein-L-isoaspartate O-methyltransferase [Patescibacteria group bacterium]|nr:protein-L-isoaspartate O-methyltransferase [Patescibacteria group bacterium]